MGRTRWLTDDEQQTWRAWLLATQLLMDQLDRELLRDAGMPHAYYAILAILSEQRDGAMRMTRLAGLLCYSKSRLSHAVRRLEERGWLRRAGHPTDRRGANAVLTEAGRAALAAAAPIHVAGVRRHLFERLSPTQIEQLRAICETIAEPLMATAGARPVHEASGPEDR